MNNRRVVFVLGLLLLAAMFVSAVTAGRHLKSEAEYQAEWCPSVGGQPTTLADGTRCDCLTSSIAFEIDFAEKWYEGLGQALHYSTVAKRHPGVALIIERPEDIRYLERLKRAIAYHDLPVIIRAIESNR